MHRRTVTTRNPCVLLLTLESTCDETAAAVIDDRLEVLASVVASQDRLHEKYGGVVPEIASRAHVERIVPVIQETLDQANIRSEQLTAIGVANTPGLAGSLLVGLSAAKALAVAWGKPLVAVNHLQAHVYACRMAARREVFPCVGMVVSGGHTSLYRCQDAVDFELLGSTIDDAAGEAFDKVASMLGLTYPGGPAIQKAAAAGNPQAYQLPRPLLGDADRLAFSFSGLKTAVRYQIAGQGSSLESATARLSSAEVADLAASFQEAAIDCLVGKAELALQQTGLARLCVGGGVAANQRFRQRLEAMAETTGVDLVVAPLALCTDNAIMGAIAIERVKQQRFESLDLDIYPRLDF